MWDDMHATNRGGWAACNDHVYVFLVPLSIFPFLFVSSSFFLFIFFSSFHLSLIFFFSLIFWSSGLPVFLFSYFLIFLSAYFPYFPISLSSYQDRRYDCFREAVKNVFSEEYE